MARRKSNVVVVSKSEERKSDLNEPKRVNLTFTKQQLNLIDEIVVSGNLGRTRAEVIKEMVMFYLKDNNKFK